MTLATAETIHGWSTRHELEWLFETARGIPGGGTWVELGIWKGRSLFTVAMGLRRAARLVAVDSFTPTVTSLPFVPTQHWVWDHFTAVLSGIRQLRPDLKIEVLRHDTAAAGALFSGTAVDVVYFDADHSRDGLARDIAAWAPRLKPGGLLCGHDYGPGFPGVVELVDETFPTRTIVEGTSIWHVWPDGAATITGRGGQSFAQSGNRP